MSPIRGNSNREMEEAMLTGPPDDIYHEKRARNNLAVKKSRSKAKTKTKEMEKKVDNLKNENDSLVSKISGLQEQLRLLKGMFIDHADNVRGVNIEDQDLETLLLETDNVEVDHAVEMLVGEVNTLAQSPATPQS